MAQNFRGALECANCHSKPATGVHRPCGHRWLCDDCTDESFCASHWEDHPARSNPEEEEAEARAHTAFPIGSPEWARETLLIRPLAWAYHSQATAWVPVAQKAKLRQVLRDQQLRSAQAAKLADAEEAAALTRLGVGER